MNNESSWPWVGFKPTKPNLNKKIPIMGGVYILTHIKTKRFYIGGTINIYDRIIKHLTDLNRNKHSNKGLQELYNKDTLFEVTFYLVGIKDIDKNIFNDTRDLEQKMLDKFKQSNLLLNIAIDSRSSHKGKKLSDEHRLKISESNKGHKHSEETINRIKLHHNKIEYKQNLSQKLTGLKRTDEFKQKMRLLNLGRKHTDETKQKLRILSTGIKQTQQTISKRQDTFKKQETVDKYTHTWSKKLKQISINGVIFNTVRQAARVLNIERKTISYRLKSNNFLDWKYR